MFNENTIDLKAAAKGNNLPAIEEASPNESQLTGQFEQSRDDINAEMKRSTNNHYMGALMGEGPKSPENKGNQGTAQNKPGYSDMMGQMESNSRKGSITKDGNRRSNRNSKRIMPPEGQ